MIFVVVFVIFAIVAVVLVRPSNETIIGTTISIGVLLWLAFWCAVIYVAFHFISKYW